jgi:hypothetical protein
MGLADGNELFLDEVTRTVHVPLSALSKYGGNINLHVHPSLKGFLRTEGDAIIFHQDMITQTIPAYLSGKREYDMIIGAL